MDNPQGQRQFVSCAETKSLFSSAKTNSRSTRSLDTIAPQLFGSWRVRGTRFAYAIHAEPFARQGTGMRSDEQEMRRKSGWGLPEAVGHAARDGGMTRSPGGGVNCRRRADFTTRLEPHSLLWASDVSVDGFKILLKKST